LVTSASSPSRHIAPPHDLGRKRGEAEVEGYGSSGFKIAAYAQDASILDAVRCEVDPFFLRFDVHDGLDPTTLLFDRQCVALSEHWPSSLRKGSKEEPA
jgi:hypothetical protein